MTPEPIEGNQIQEVTLRIPFAKQFVYANVASFSVSMMDIRISFGEAMPDQTVEARVGVVMGPEQAAQLALSLMQQVHIFEKTFGAVRNPLWQALKTQPLRELAGEGMPDPEEPSR